MKPYYYLLFRIYRFYLDQMKEKDIPLIYVSAISTILIYFNLLTLLAVIGILVIEVQSYISNKFFVITSLLFLWIANYYLFVRRKKFLEFNFKKNQKGGIFVFIYIIFSALSFIIFANYYRANLL